MMKAFAVLALIILILSTLIGCAAPAPTPTPTPQPTVTPEPCSADFIVDPTPGNCKVEGEVISCTGTTTVHFTDKSTGNVTSWAWDFGDSKTSTLQNPIKTYSKDGNYTVTLTITTPQCQDTLSKPNYIKIKGCST